MDIYLNMSLKLKLTDFIDEEHQEKRDNINTMANNTEKILKNNTKEGNTQNLIQYQKIIQ